MTTPGCCRLILLVGLGACARSPVVHYYTLTATPPPPPGPALAAAPFVAVGPVSIPEAVDRPEIVLRVSPTQVAVAEQHQWEGPLADEIARAMADDLARALPQARVAPVAPGEGHRDLEVLVNVQRFDSELGRDATLEALWTVRRPDRTEVRSGRSLVRVAPGAGGYDALVAAHAHAVARLSGEIAEAIRAEAPVAGR
jgi:uncharacterized lipoprotein YmbA